MVLLWDNTQVEKRKAWTHQAVQGHLSEERTLEQDSRTGLTPPPSLQSEEEEKFTLALCTYQNTPWPSPW